VINLFIYLLKNFLLEMEENIRIEISETNRGKKQIIINRKYKFKFNFLNEKKDNPNVHRYIEYRTSNKC